MSTNYYVNIGKAEGGLSIGNRNINAVSNAQDILEKSKIKLENNYKRPNAYMRSFLKQKNVAIESNDLPIKDYFVEVTLQKKNNLGETINENICLDAIFSKKCKHQTILLIGDAGYGKTTLCKKIAYDWASNDENVAYLNHFYFSVFIDLHLLGEKTLFQAVTDTIFENLPQKRRPKLSDANLNILVILDGFDEFSDTHSIIKFLNNDSVDISSEITILITSRPQNIELIRKYIDLQFYIEGFSQEQQEEYIKKNFEKNSHCLVLLEHIRQNEFLNNIAECPLMLNIMCSLFQNEGIRMIKRLTDLYLQMMSQMAKHYMSNCNNTIEVSPNLKNGKYFVGENLLIKLLKKFPYPLNCQNLISSTSLNEYFTNKNDFDYIVGIKILYKISETENASSYDVMHETFHEFLSALCLKLEQGDLPYLSYYTFLFILGLCADDDCLPQFPKLSMRRLIWDSKLQENINRELNYKKSLKIQEYLDIIYET